MAYIEPNSDVRLLNYIPMDNTYEHTLFFMTETAQEQYFLSKTHRTYEDYSYIRKSEGVIKVDASADSLIACNYLMYRNTAFGPKWFYAFITSINYLANATAEITFELDVIQTWFFSAHIGPCFVERETSATDNMYEHLLPEGLELGDSYIVADTDRVDMSNMSVCVMSSRTANGDTPEMDIVNGVFTGLQRRSFDLSKQIDIDTLKIYINAFINKGYEEAIVAIYQYPSWIGDASATAPATKEHPITFDRTVIPGYGKPRNKKLLNHPYRFLLATNNDGGSATYKYEDWNAPDVSLGFRFYGVAYSTPAVFAVPLRYRGILGIDWDSGLILNRFPQCAWVGDTFKAWWAQHQNRITNTLGELAVEQRAREWGTAANIVLPFVGRGGQQTTALSAYPFSFPGGYGMDAQLPNPALQNAGYIGGQIGEFIGKSWDNMKQRSAIMMLKEDIKQIPPQVYGQAQTESLSAAVKRTGFSFYDMSIKPEIARILDSYFDRYGYACHLTKVPNRNVRPEHTYTKTVGCHVTGSVPVEYADLIARIYDAGITFWNNPDHFCNYNLDNSPNGDDE